MNVFSIIYSFEAKLTEVFKDIHEAYEKIEGRLKAEQFKVRWYKLLNIIA